MNYPLAIAWGLFSYVLLQLLLLLTGVIWPDSGADLVTRVACEALVFVLATYAIVRWYLPERAPSRAVGLRPTHPRLPLFGLMLGLSMRLPADSISAQIERIYPTSEEELFRRMQLLQADTPGQALFLVLAVAIVVPLVEEVFYRGALFGAVARNKGLVSAGVVSGLLFLFGHQSLRDLPALTLVTIVLSYLRIASGSLLPSLAIHVGFNTLGVLAIVMGFAGFGQPLEVSPVATVLSWVVTLLLCMGVQRVASNSAEAADARQEDHG